VAPALRLGSSVASARVASELETTVQVGGMTFGDRVAEAVDRKRSQVLVGLDPRPELFPVELRGEPRPKQWPEPVLRCSPGQRPGCAPR